MKAFIGFILGVIVGAIGLAVAAFLVVWSGTVSAAASQPRDAIDVVLAYAREQSIDEHAGTPLDIPDSDERVLEGLREFSSMCVMCHGGPGVEADGFLARGLNPTPPDLSRERTQSRPDDELIWIVRHGIRMSGMPAVGETHSEEELLALVAAIRALPELTPEQREILAGGGHGHAEHGGQRQEDAAEGSGEGAGQGRGTHGQEQEHGG